MKSEKIAEVLSKIHMMGYDNTYWNVETEEQPSEFYGQRIGEQRNLSPHIPPHIALYYDDENSLEMIPIYALRDHVIETREMGLIYIYEL